MQTPHAKRKFSFISSTTTNIGLAIDQLNELQEIYHTFLSQQKDVGAGPTTRLQSKQEDRNSKIATIDEHFKVLMRQQTAENWKALLINLTQFYIALYTENTWYIKTSSTFGDALRAVHLHLLDTIKNSGLNKPDDPVVKTLCGSIENPAEPPANQPDIQSLHEHNVTNAAFGHYGALVGEYPTLVEQNTQVSLFIKEISTNQQKQSQPFGSVFFGGNSPGITYIENPSRKLWSGQGFTG